MLAGMDFISVGLDNRTSFPLGLRLLAMLRGGLSGVQSIMAVRSWLDGVGANVCCEVGPTLSSLPMARLAGSG